jgi:hypothetical protein
MKPSLSGLGVLASLAVIKGMAALEGGEYWIRKGGEWQIIRP